MMLQALGLQPGTGSQKLRSNAHDGIKGKEPPLAESQEQARQQGLQARLRPAAQPVQARQPLRQRLHHRDGS